MLRAGVLVAVLALAALAGCGGGDKVEKASNPPAQPYSKRSTVADTVARVTPEDYRRPIATSTRYVGRQLGALLGEVAALRAAIARHDLDGARAAWLKAQARYESIGAATGRSGTSTPRSTGDPPGSRAACAPPTSPGCIASSSRSGSIAPRATRRRPRRT
jgi:hypothetical protein